MKNLFRLRVKDGYVSPATRLTNCHGIDMENMVIPGEVGEGIIKGTLNWRDVVRCVAAGKDPSILLTKPDAAKPRTDLEGAADFDQTKTVNANIPPPTPPKSEFVLAREENRAPDLLKLTPEELVLQAGFVGVLVDNYKTQGGLVRAIQKKMDEIAATPPVITEA